MSLEKTICYRCLKDGPMPKQYDWICGDCSLKDSQRHVITAAEKRVLDCAYAYVVAHQAVPDDFEWDDPRIDDLLEARDALIKAVTA